jgi:hypothetical protein
MTHRIHHRRECATRFLAAVIAAVVVSGQAIAGQHYQLCRDADGNPYFTDGSCPADTVAEGRGYAANSQTYGGRESIDTGTLNRYEQRHDTRRQWSWETVPAQPR